ncbi:YhcN/YlaJ family sporulation lipoprotein [Cytobacillus purgationiresistens]|uniref:YhcN/YlaJ family sporulation lipoprotein n=1 Tax=Cytobacillus purgationiresistens TaxID=863449 RepID=A0ABU0ACN9_9BACI|nr:YhcN/YlaJ family sporulation lipoprotein [Cytobacillus purgationiresistens]MDQ0269021.1 YhcN/YlaJ family sporulation lipoprotein [Cytobacillus purgationiresistens]
MNIKRKLIVTLALTTIALSACGFNNNGATDSAKENRNINEPAKVNHRSNDNLHLNNKREVQNNPTRVKNETPNVKTADHIDAKLVKIKDVDNAHVFVTDHHAYVAAKLNNEDNHLSKDVEREISDKVKAADPDIENVYISVNPDFYGRMHNFSNDVQRGKPVEGFYEQFKDAVRSVFPTHFKE